MSPWPVIFQVTFTRSVEVYPGIDNLYLRSYVVLLLARVLTLRGFEGVNTPALKELDEPEGFEEYSSGKYAFGSQSPRFSPFGPQFLP